MDCVTEFKKNIENASVSDDKILENFANLKLSLRGIVVGKIYARMINVAIIKHRPHLITILEVADVLAKIVKEHRKDPVLRR